MSGNASVQLAYVAAGCNRIVGALDWGEGGLIAYCAHHAIFIYDPQACTIVATLLGHTDTATCVKWISAADFGLLPNALPADAPLALVSGGGDGTACIWLLSLNNPEQPWSLAAKVPAHQAPITSVTLHTAGSPGHFLLVTTAGDGDVTIWSANASHPLELATEGCWQLEQRISYGTKLQHCAALAPLPSDPDTLLLALGGVDGKVRLLLQNKSSGTDFSDFSPACELNGHQNWVRGLAFTQQGSKLVLASASQDRCIRLWAVTEESLNSSSGGGDENRPGVAGNAPAVAALMKYAPRPLFTAPSGARYQATLEALLIGHEDWVHSVAWQPRKKDDGASKDEDEALPCLLSASMDRTMVLWVPDKATGLWLSQESVGDAGVNHLGYYTGVWNPDGTAILAHGYTGALHMWCRTPDGDLVPQPAVGGHCGPIVDATWAADGGCMLTVSTDQTARLTTKLHSTDHWSEVARPQVHGHDFSCVAAVPAEEKDTYLYVSGSEEKVLRVFEAPRAFEDTLAMARNRPLSLHQQRSQSRQHAGGLAPSSLAYGASLPALGLSQKAVYVEIEAEAAGDANGESEGTDSGLGMGGYNEFGPDVVPTAAPSAVSGPPFEEHLAGSTLWPEIHKLYGHGNEVYCVASHPAGTVLASACRAQSAATAGIMLWDTATWTACAALKAHTLTVTQLAFSPNGLFLASASRDRSVAIFKHEQLDSTNGAAGSAAPEYALASHFKAHSRIVWGVSWAPDSQLLATASRDGSAKLWIINKDGSIVGNTAAATLPFKDGVRSVAFAPQELGDSTEHHHHHQQQHQGTRKRCFVGVGLDGGEVVVGIVSWRQQSNMNGNETSEETGSNVASEPGPASNNSANVEWEEVWRTSVGEKHAAAVRRLCWRTVDGASSNGAEKFELASVSDDHSLRIFEIA